MLWKVFLLNDFKYYWITIQHKQLTTVIATKFLIVAWNFRLTMQQLLGKKRTSQRSNIKLVIEKIYSLFILESGQHFGRINEFKHGLLHYTQSLFFHRTEKERYGRKKKLGDSLNKNGCLRVFQFRTIPIIHILLFSYDKLLVQGKFCSCTIKYWYFHVD